MRSPRFLLDSILLCVSAGSLGAQENPWTKQATLPTSGTVMNVAVLSPTEVWAPGAPLLGNVAEIGHTRDAGLSWEVTDLGAHKVNAVFFVDDQHGWAAGNAFRHTTDGGQTWVTDNQWGSIYDLFFLDTQHGWACGNGAVAYRTTDGGLNWAAVSTGGGSTMSSIWFIDEMNGWSVGINGEIVQSTDGGQSWTLAWHADAYLSTIQFFDDQEGWAIGGNTFLHTTDGGQTWMQSVVPQGTWSHGARFFDAMHGISVGEFGNIVRTMDGGQTWSMVQPVGSGPRLWDVEYADLRTVVYSGDGGAIARSLDGGATWSPIQSGAWGITRGLDVHDAQTAWAACQGGEIVRTTNGGKLWERAVVDGFSVYGDLHDIEFSDPLQGWAVGENEYFGGSDGRVSRSTDGGRTWDLQLSIPNAEFFGIAAIDAQTALAYGRGLFASSTCLRTADGGNTWMPAGPPAGNGFRGSFFLDETTGWLVGNSIWKTTDAGLTWTEQQQGSGAQLAAVSFADAQHGWAVGFANQVLRTTDGGQNWVPQDSGASSSTGLMGVSATSPTTAWITGWYGFVARTTDGGQSWQQESIPGASDAYFECAEFLDAERGWVAGDDGIFFRDPGGDCSVLTRYCISTPNSTGAPARMDWDGSCVALENDFRLWASPVPNRAFLFFFGPNQTQTSFGNGFLCVGGGLTRLNPAGLASGNLAQRQVDLAAYGLTAGTTVNFQCWFRDPIGGGAHFNTTDGLSVTFE